MNLLRLCRVAVSASSIIAIATHPAAAQTDVFISHNMQFGAVDRGTYDRRTKVGFEGSVGWRWNADARFSPILQLSGGHQSQLPAGHELSCRLIAGRCRPTAPDLLYGEIAAGVAIRYRALSVGAMVGPGLFYANFTGSSADERPTIPGLSGRTEVYLRIVPGVEVGVAASTKYLPDFLDEQLFANTLATGLRLTRAR